MRSPSRDDGIASRQNRAGHSSNKEAANTVTCLRFVSTASELMRIDAALSGNLNIRTLNKARLFMRLKLNQFS